jgi:hypothetical protein
MTHPPKPGTFPPGNKGGPGAPPLGDKKRVKVWASVLPADHARIVSARVGEEKTSETVARLILAGLDRG